MNTVSGSQFVTTYLCTSSHEGNRSSTISTLHGSGKGKHLQNKVAPGSHGSQQFAQPEARLTNIQLTKLYSTPRVGCNPYMGNPYMGYPYMGFPYMGNPYMGVPYMGYRLFAIDMLRFCRKHESGAEYLSKKNFSNSLCSLIRNIISHNMKNVSQLTQMS